MIIHEHDAGKHRGRFFDRGIAIGGGELIKKLENLRVLKVFPEQGFRAFVQITEKAQEGHGVSAQRWEGFFWVGFIGAGVAGVFHHHMRIHAQQVVIKAADVVGFVGEYF